MCTGVYMLNYQWISPPTDEQLKADFIVVCPIENEILKSASKLQLSFTKNACVSLFPRLCVKRKKYMVCDQGYVTNCVLFLVYSDNLSEAPEQEEVSFR